jgi:hypothetical protein
MQVPIGRAALGQARGVTAGGGGGAAIARF